MFKLTDEQKQQIIEEMEHMAEIAPDGKGRVMCNDFKNHLDEMDDNAWFAYAMIMGMYGGFEDFKNK